MDKRAFPRAELNIPFTLVCNDAETTGETQDVSLNGLFAKIGEDLELNSSVKLLIKPEEDKPDIVECHGKIVRKTDSGVGIQIESMELQSYIKWRYIVTQATLCMAGLEQETPTFVVQ